MLVIDGEARCWTSPTAFRTAITDELLAELTAQAEAAIAKAERQQARVAAEIAQIRAGLTRLSRRSLLTRIKRIRALRARRAVALAKAGLTLIAVAGWTAAIITWALEQAA